MANNNDNCFSNLSYRLTKLINKKEKKDNGIYFTPPNTVVKCLDILLHILNYDVFNNILEPSCGSCEFIDKLITYYPNASITGVEYNKIIYDNIKNNYDNVNNVNNINIFNDNFLKTHFNEKFDLIIGNPPYYVLKKSEVDQYYYNYFDGRPNIFLLFIIKSLSLLNDNGVLCFILPKSFLNCLYYNKTREYIYNNFQILSIEECNDVYIETDQQTIIFIIKKSISNDNANDKYILKHMSDKYTIFSTREAIKRLNELYINATTLNALKFKVYVGNIVWNENKSLLTDNEQKTRLIYSTDIKNNTLSIKKYTNTAKKNYINREGYKEPLLVINRGYGVGNYNFEYSLINCEHSDGFFHIKEYLIENHLICIKYEGDEQEYSGDSSDDYLINKYIQIYRSFSDERTVEFIKLYFGNNAINTTELSNILPIYL